MQSKAAKILIAIAIVLTIVIPSIMDLNSTHMTNPLWPPHARFHWSIQWYSMTILNCMALFLVCGKYKENHTYLATIIAFSSPILFWGMFFPSLLMPGTSPWPDGVEPFMYLPPNIFLAICIVVMCIFGGWLELRAKISS